MYLQAIRIALSARNLIQMEISSDDDSGVDFYYSLNSSPINENGVLASDMRKIYNDPDNYPDIKIEETVIDDSSATRHTIYTFKLKTP